MTWPYLVRIDTADHTENEAVDTLAKRVVASNLNHLAKSHGQVLVNWSVADSSGVQRSMPPLNFGDVAMWKSEAFALRLRPDGSAFPLRVRLRGRRTTAGTGVTFKLSLSNADSLSAHFVTSSTTGAWRTAESAPYDALISPTADDVRGLIQSVGAPSSLGGAIVSSPEALARIHVSCYLSSEDVVELTGVYVSEFYGA